MANILLLEDNEDFRMVLAENLEDAGHAVTQAGSGQQALQLARGQRFDLLLTDVRMAGMDGIDALTELRKAQPDLKSIVMTGYANDEAPSRAIGQRTSDYLFKPFKLQELQTAVDRALTAEEQASRDQAKLASVMGGFKKLVTGLGSLLGQQPLKVLEKNRHEAYNGLYVAIRSKSLAVDQALKLWDDLEELEGKRQSLNTEQLDSEKCKELSESYSWVLKVLEALKKSPMSMIRRETEGQVGRGQFSHFYSAVQEGRVPPSWMSLAFYVRSADEPALRQSPDLVKLRSSFWGVPA